MKLVLIIFSLASVSLLFFVNWLLNYKAESNPFSAPMIFDSRYMEFEDRILIASHVPAQLEPESEVTTQSSCPSVPILTSVDDGRLGNKMWEYSSLWTLSKAMGRPGYAPHTMLANLSQVFSNIQLPDFNDIRHCNLSLNKEPMAADKFNSIPEVVKNYQTKNILLKKDLELPHLVLSSFNELQNHFQFRSEILRQVEDTIDEFYGTGRVIVGVHVRRTDYKRLLVKWYNMSYITKEYYLYAMKWFRNKIKKPLLFMIVSDDNEWCKANLLDHDDVVIASKSAAHDMALLATSNHTIIDYGTFGQWGAMLSAARGFVETRHHEMSTNQVFLSDLSPLQNRLKQTKSWKID